MKFSTRLLSNDDTHAYVYKIWKYHHDRMFIKSVLTHWLLGDMAIIFKMLFFKLIVENSRLCTRGEIVLRWKPRNLTNKNSTLVQAMAWWNQTLSHYLSQYWPKSMSFHGATKPQSINRNRTSNFPSDMIRTKELGISLRTAILLF